MVRKKDEAGGKVDEPTETRDTQVRGGPKDSTPQKTSGGNTILAVRNLLEYTVKGTGIDSMSQDYFYLGRDGYLRVPLRGQSIAEPPRLEGSGVILVGNQWGADGNVMVPANPMTGYLKVSADEADYSYVATQWADENYYRSHGGRIYHCLDNYIKAADQFSAADRVILTKALLGYNEIARAVMLFFTAHNCNIEGLLNRIIGKPSGGTFTLNQSSGTNPGFSSTADLIGQVILKLSEDYFPWPMFNFWAHRPGHFAVPVQFPFYKEALYVPNEPYTMSQGLARIFDYYMGTTGPWIHPKTYLQSNGLWNEFLTDFVPLIFGKSQWMDYVGIRADEYLKAINWEPRRKNYVYRDWYENMFITYPFDHLGGVQEYRQMEHNVDDTTTTLQDWYWKSSQSGKGWVFYLHPDSFNPQFYTPFLDPVMFQGLVKDNYNADTGTLDPEEGISVLGNISWDGSSYQEITYDQFRTWFPWAYKRYMKISNEDAAPDIMITDDADGKRYGMEYEMYRHPFRFPFRMPKLHWYEDKRKVIDAYCIWLGTDRSDIQLYDRQAIPTATSAYQSSQDSGRID